MATNFVESIGEKFLKCGVCLENFRSPRGLPCLHSFCEECLERWAKKSKKPGVLTCPNCMKETTIPKGGVAEFPAQFMVNSLQESVDNEKKAKDAAIGSPIVCDICKIPAKSVTVHCLDCKEFMCEACCSAHKKFNAFKDHQVVSVEDLQSGKVSTLLKKTQDRYCTEHDGEQKRFYCETCSKLVCRDCIVMKQHCRDHDYTSLREASQRKTTSITTLIDECCESKKSVQTAISETMAVGNNLKANLKQSKQHLVSGVGSMRMQLDNILSSYEKEVKTAEMKKTAILNDIEKGLQESLCKIDSACELGKKLNQSESDLEILSNYTFIMEALQEARKTKAISADAALAKIEIPSLPSFKEWEVRHFDTQGDEPFGITTSPGNGIAVNCGSSVKVFSKSGEIQQTFNAPIGFDITSTQDGKYVITGHYEKKCLVYDVHGKEVLSFHIFDTNNQPSYPRSVAIDNKGNIIVGSEPDTISTHTSTGTLISKFKVNGSPWGLTITRKGNIAIAINLSSLQLVTPSGEMLKSVPQPAAVTNWTPYALCCSNRDELFVTNRGDPKGVYMYTSDGEYLGCVTTGIGMSRGVTLSHDDQELFVTDTDAKEVKIFKRP